MDRCRYYKRCPQSSTCDGYGVYVGFGNSLWDCDDYEPMPDFSELRDIAQEMDRMPQCELCPAEIVNCSEHPDGCPDALLSYYARRIQEILDRMEG